MTDIDVSAEAADRESPEIFQIHSTDIDHARAILKRFYYPIAVTTPGGADDFAMRIELIELGPLTVGEVGFAGPVSLLIPDLDGYHVTMPTSGRVLTRQGGNEVLASPEVGAVFRPGMPVRSRNDPNSAQLEIKIDAPTLENELGALLGREVDGPIDLRPAMDLSNSAARSWRRFVGLLLEELRHKESLIHQPLIAKQVRHSVLSGLLLSVPHRFHDELTAPARPGPPRAVRRVLDAIHDEPERAFSVTELAALGGMSVRSLQEGFRRHVGCAPMNHLQQVRLTRANQALRQADPARTTVAAIAHRWGFAHLGRFASAYRTRFGEPPSETLRSAS
jgi:AraC-like DNA-binding protein